MVGQEPIKPGDRVILHGEVADFRGDFALVTVDGSAPDSGYLSVDCGAFELVDGQAVLHGEITAIRGGFAVAVLDGSLPPGSMISVTPGAVELDEAGELPALAFRLTSGPVLPRSSDLGPACRREMARPPHDDLRVPARELEDPRRWPWRSGWHGRQVASSRSWKRPGARQRLAAFRGELYRCLAARADKLLELADSALCAAGPVKTLAGLSLAPEHRRGHGALYDAVNVGRVAVGRLRRALAALPLPRWDDGQIRMGVDVSPWLRPDAATSPERLFCHVYGQGKVQAQMIPGWPYSVVAALEPGRKSWTAAVLDAVRLGPDDDETAVTAAQVREVVARLAAAGTGGTATLTS